MKVWFLFSSVRLFADTFIQITYTDSLGRGVFCHLLAIPNKDRLVHVVKYLLDEEEFLSPFGIRSLSKVHEKQPFVMQVEGETYTVGYVPGESNTYVFGGNSNWRGPIWLCGESQCHSISLSISSILKWSLLCFDTLEALIECCLIVYNTHSMRAHTTHTQSTTSL